MLAINKEFSRKPAAIVEEFIPAISEVDSGAGFGRGRDPQIETTPKTEAFVPKTVSKPKSIDTLVISLTYPKTFANALERSTASEYYNTSSQSSSVSQILPYVFVDSSDNTIVQSITLQDQLNVSSNFVYVGGVSKTYHKTLAENSSTSYSDENVAAYTTSRVLEEAHAYSFSDSPALSTYMHLSTDRLWSYHRESNPRNEQRVQTYSAAPSDIEQVEFKENYQIVSSPLDLPEFSQRREYSFKPIEYKQEVSIDFQWEKEPSAEFSPVEIVQTVDAPYVLEPVQKDFEVLEVAINSDPLISEVREYQPINQEIVSLADKVAEIPLVYDIKSNHVEQEFSPVEVQVNSASPVEISQREPVAYQQVSVQPSPLQVVDIDVEPILPTQVYAETSSILDAPLIEQVQQSSYEIWEPRIVESEFSFVEPQIDYHIETIRVSEESVEVTLEDTLSELEVEAETNMSFVYVSPPKQEAEAEKAQEVTKSRSLEKKLQYQRETKKEERSLEKVKKARDQNYKRGSLEEAISADGVKEWINIDQKKAKSQCSTVAKVVQIDENLYALSVGSTVLSQMPTKQEYVIRVKEKDVVNSRPYYETQAQDFVTKSNTVLALVDRYLKEKNLVAHYEIDEGQVSIANIMGVQRAMRKDKEDLEDISIVVELYDKTTKESYAPNLTKTIKNPENYELRIFLQVKKGSQNRTQFTEQIDEEYQAPELRSLTKQSTYRFEEFGNGRLGISEYTPQAGEIFDILVTSQGSDNYDNKDGSQVLRFIVNEQDLQKYDRLDQIIEDRLEKQGLKPVINEYETFKDTSSKTYENGRAANNKTKILEGVQGMYTQWLAKNPQGDAMDLGVLVVNVKGGSESSMGIAHKYEGTSVQDYVMHTTQATVEGNQVISNNERMIPLVNGREVSAQYRLQAGDQLSLASASKVVNIAELYAPKLEKQAA